MADFLVNNPDSAVEREVMSKGQTFRSKDMPFGIANGKSQIPKYGIRNLRSEMPVASEDLLLQAREGKSLLVRLVPTQVFVART
jgi:hypothetical protein